MITHLLKWIYNKKLKRQLILMYLPVVIILVLLIIVIILVISTQIVRNNTKVSVFDTMNIVRRNIEEQVNHYSSTSLEIITDYNLYKLILEKPYSLSYYSYYKELRSRMNQYVQSYENIDLITIFDKNGSIVIQSDGIRKDIKLENNLEKLKKIIKQYKTTTWSLESLVYKNGNLHSIYLNRSIPIKDDYEVILEMQIDETGFESIYSDILKYAKVYIINEKGTIISHQEKDMIGQTNYYLINQIGDRTSGVIEHYGVDNSMLMFSKIRGVDWRLIVEVPNTYLAKDVYKLIATIILVGIVIIIILIIISLLLSSAIVKPMELIGNAMTNVEKHDFSNYIYYPYKNEIGEIVNQYNDMIKRIKELMSIIQEKEKEKRLVDLKFLQAQINPHFIYNTLFSIKCLASMKKQKDIEKLLESFINLLMATISNNEPLITIDKEVSYIEDYVHLMEFKYDKDIFFEIYIDEEIKYEKIPRLLLQPLIENSILHGMQGIDDFEIIIDAHKKNNYLFIYVIDNGVGLDSKRMNTNLSKSKNGKEKLTSIGVNNIYQRILLYYGNEGKFYYDEHIERGTKAVIEIPLKKQNIEGDI